MAEVLGRSRPYPSEAASALFAPAERWGWALDVPPEYKPSDLRNSPPTPRPGEDHAVAYQRWREQIEAEEEALGSQSTALATWTPRRPQEDYAMAAVFGGTTTGWHALLTTLGGSVLGSGSSMTIVNLSERAVTDSLRKLAKKSGYRVRFDTVSPKAAGLDLFGFVGREQLIDFLVDVIYPDDPAASAEAREDRALLREVVGALQDELTCERLQAGLRVLLREAGPPQRGDVLRADQYQRLSSLVGEYRRQHTDVMQRAVRLAHALDDFVALERAARHAPPERDDVPIDLRVLQAERTPDRLDAEFNARLLVAAVIRRAVRRRVQPGGQREMLVVLGADRLGRRLIDSLSDLAEEGSLQLVLVFAHLRDDALDALGASKAAVCFMRLTDYREAEQASKQIGTKFDFVVSQVTKSRSENYERAHGTNQGQESGRSTSRGPDFGTTVGESSGRSSGTSTNVSQGQSFTASETEQVMDRPIAEAHVIQALPETGLLFVDLTTRRPVFADCDPTILTRADERRF